MHARLSEVLPRGYVAAFRILGNRQEAQDACQEAAARALAHRSTYDPSRPFYPWFHRILKNHCLDRLAGRKRQEADLPSEPPSPGPTAEALVLRTERAQTIGRAIESLPADLRQVIELRHFEDASYEDMAEILEIPVGTVMSRLYRARRKLRDHLSEDSGFFTPAKGTS